MKFACPVVSTRKRFRRFGPYSECYRRRGRDSEISRSLVEDAIAKEVEEDEEGEASCVNGVPEDVNVGAEQRGGYGCAGPKLDIGKPRTRQREEVGRRRRTYEFAREQNA